MLKRAGLGKLLEKESKDPRKVEEEKRKKKREEKGEKEDEAPISNDPEDLYDTGIYFKCTEGGSNLSVGER